jgi:hypothetical protein
MPRGVLSPSNGDEKTTGTAAWFIPLGHYGKNIAQVSIAPVRKSFNQL